MILARMHLPQNPAHAWTIITKQDKQIFNHKTVCAKFVD